MPIKYKKIHTSFKTLAEDAKVLVDAYVASKISDSEFDAVLNEWTMYCPNLMYEDDNQTIVAFGLSRIIGKKRSVVLTMAFRRLANQTKSGS